MKKIDFNLYKDIILYIYTMAMIGGKENDKLKKERKELKKEISNMKVNNGKYTRLLKDFKVDDANDIFNMIHQLKEEIKELKEKQVWFERNSKFMIDVYEYADDLWKENSEQRPKICVREPHEILSMMKQLKEELKELKQ